MRELPDIERYRRLDEHTPTALKLMWSAISVALTALVVLAVATNAKRFLESGMTDKEHLKKAVLSLVAVVIPIGLTATCRDLWRLKDIVRGTREPWVL